MKNGTWLAVLLSSAVAVSGFATLGHSLVGPKLRGVNELIASAFSLKELVGFLAGFGTTFAAFPDLVAMLKRRSSQGMNPGWRGPWVASRYCGIWYGDLIGSDPVIVWNIIAVVIDRLALSVPISVSPGWRLRRSSRCLASHRPSMTIFGLQRAVP